MKIIFALFKLFNFNPALQALLNAGWIWKLMRNYGLIKQTAADAQSVIEEMLKRHDPTPTCEETKKLVECLKRVVDAELIDIPGVNEADLSRVLQNIEDNLVCKFEPKKLTTKTETKTDA